MPVLISLPDIIQADGIDTSDATARDQHIVEGYTAYVQGRKVTGSMSKLEAMTYTPSQVNQVIAKEQYLDGDQIILGDPNLIAENIKEGVAIFGVEGTYESGSTEESAYLLYSASSGAMTDYGSVIYIEGSNGLVLQNAATLVTTNPELCSEENEYALNFSHSFLGWGGTGRTCFLTSIEIPSASSDISVKFNVNNGSSVSNFLIRLVQATGETPEELAANIIANAQINGSFIGLSGYMPYTDTSQYTTLLYEKINSTDLTGQFYLYIEPTADNSAPKFKEIKVTIK